MARAKPSRAVVTLFGCRSAAGAKAMECSTEVQPPPWHGNVEQRLQLAWY